LSARGWAATIRRRRKSPPRKERRFAEVGDAVVKVLGEAGCELRMIEIHAAVEDLLGEPVSRSSVKNYLARGCRRRLPVFERVGRGRYRLIASTAELRGANIVEPSSVHGLSKPFQNHGGPPKRAS
jgi:hypothetical protein